MTLEVGSLAEWEKAGIPGLLSVVIPAHNEAGEIESTVRNIVEALQREAVEHEVLVINDNSTDETEEILKALSEELPSVRYLNNVPPNGFGFALRLGLDRFQGDAVAIVMADGSDDPKDLLRFYDKLQEDFDCVFGSRFGRQGKVIDYPWPKLVLNRLANKLIQVLFLTRNDDVTNAFKLYRRRVIAGLAPLLSFHFNLLVELPLKAMVRGYRIAIVPNSWRNRKHGISKFKIREMGSRYLFVILYCFLEKLLSRGDYRRRSASEAQSPRDIR